MRFSRVALLALALVLVLVVAGSTLAPAAACPSGQCKTNSDCNNFCCAVLLYCPPYPAGDSPTCRNATPTACGRCYC